jgi:peptide chain release factor 2
MITEQEFNDKINKAKQLFNALNLDQEVDNFNELKNKIEDENVWKDTVKATQIQKNLSTLEKKIKQINEFKSLIDNLEIAFELNEEDSLYKILSEIEFISKNLETRLYLNGKFDLEGAIMTIHSGAGGLDAQDFASMLLNMYQSFAKRMDFELIIVSLSLGDEGGIKSVMVEIKGESAYGLLKEEAGVHRLVRISPFNSGKTRETSFALVEVIPNNLEKSGENDIEIDQKDLKWDFYMASGKGGQSVNTTYSAVRVVHLPTGITVTCQNERSQQQNKDQALKYLKNKLMILKLQTQDELRKELKGQFVKIEWGQQIRNYVLHPYKLVKDQRSGFQSSEVDKILIEGDLIDLIWSVKLSSKES